MGKIYSTDVKYFNKDEFPEDPEEFADPVLIFSLDRLRGLIGNKIYPSPVKGALARFDERSKKSQHYAVDRKSTAIDIFPEGDPYINLLLILQSKLFNGVGVYFDTYYFGRFRTMFHLDLRENPLLWTRTGHTYRYQSEPFFWYELKEQLCQTLL